MMRRSGRMCGIAIGIALGSMASARADEGPAGPVPGLGQGDPDDPGRAPARRRGRGPVHRGLLPARFDRIATGSRRSSRTRPSWSRRPRRPPDPAAVAAGRRRRRRPRDPGGPGRGRFPRGRDQPDRRRESQAHWAQPCIRVDRYAGVKTRARRRRPTCPAASSTSTAGRSRMPTTPWATTARLHARAGLVPRGRQPRRRQPPAAELDRPVQRADRLLLGRRQELLATAWEPYQELFQGVIVCLHSDFRIGGLKPGAVQDDPGQDLPDAGRSPGARWRRYRRDFPEQAAPGGPPRPASRRGSYRVRLGRAGARASCAGTSPSWSGRRSTAASSTSSADAPGRRRRISPGSAGAGGRSRGRAEARPATTSRRSRRVDAVPPQLPPLQHDARRPRLVRRPFRRDRQRPAGRRARPRRPLPGDPARHRAIRGEALRLLASSATRSRRPGPSTPPRPVAAAAR